MSKVVLVTGGNTLTGRKLIEKLLSREFRVITPVPGKGSESPETGTKNLTVLNWNRASWFSTKNLVREILRIHGELDAAFVLNHHISSGLALDEMDSSQVENVLEQSVKSDVSLVRELTALPLHGGKDAFFLGMVIPHRKGGAPEPLDALAEGAFKGFAASVIRNNRPGWWSCGFVNTSADAESFAEALIDRWQQRPPKLRGNWYRYAEGKRPFGGSGIVDTIK